MDTALLFLLQTINAPTAVHVLRGLGYYRDEMTSKDHRTLLVGITTGKPTLIINNDHRSTLFISSASHATTDGDILASIMKRFTRAEDILVHTIEKGVTTTKLLMNLLFNSDVILPGLQHVLDSIGDEKIVRIVLARRSFPSYADVMLNIATFGDYYWKVNNRGMPKARHMLMLIQLESGEKWILQKDPDVQLIPYVPISSTLSPEYLKVTDLPRGLTLNVLLDRTRVFAGHLFNNYDLETNNCQDHCLQVLQSNGMNDPRYYFFLKQELQKYTNQYEKVLFAAGSAVWSATTQIRDELK